MCIRDSRSTGLGFFEAHSFPPGTRFKRAKAAYLPETAFRGTASRKVKSGMAARGGEMTLPCPGGQGALRMCVFDAVCPMGAKALQSGAPDMGVSRKKAVPPSALPIRGLCRRAGEGEALRALFCGGHGVSALPSAHERRKVHRPASPAAALFPCHPAWRPAGSARTRPRDQSLGDPFLGDRSSSPPSSRLPVPQNAAGGKPLLVGLPPSASSPAPQET